MRPSLTNSGEGITPGLERTLPSTPKTQPEVNWVTSEGSSGVRLMGVTERGAAGESVKFWNLLNSLRLETLLDEDW